MARRRKQVEVAKDYGEISVPESWDDVTLELFVKLMRAQEDKGGELSTYEVMALMTGRDVKFMYSLPSDFAHSILARLMFLAKPLPQEGKPDVVIEGERYSINIMEKLRFGEYTDANMVLKSDKFAYAALLAILCRKDGETYDDEFIADKMERRMAMWNAQPITKVYPLACFFLRSWIASGQRLEAFMMDARRRLTRYVESLGDSARNGAVKKYSMTYWRVLWKSRRLRKSISRL